MASARMLPLLLLSLSIARQSVSVSATVTAVSKPSVLAVVSVTAITGLQIRRQFRLRPKSENVVSVGLYPGRYAVIGCKLKQNANDGCNSCASLARLVLCFVACFILLVIAP